MTRLATLLAALGALAAPAAAQQGTVVSRDGRQLVVQLAENVGVIGGSTGDVLVPETQLTSAEVMVSVVDGTTATCTIFHESDAFPAKEGYPVSFDRPVVKGTLVVTSEPAGAAVTVDGGRTGRTPTGRLSLPPGTYTVGVTHAGYAPDSARVTVAAGEETAHHFALRSAAAAEAPAPAMVRLLMTSTPGNAHVIVNGTVRGYTPDTGLPARPIDLPAESPLVVEVQLEKYVPQYDTLTVAAGQVWEEHYALEEKRAPLNVLVYPWGSSVVVDDAPVGRTPYAGALPWGYHTVRVERPGYVPFAQDSVFVWGMTSRSGVEMAEIVEGNLRRAAGWLRVAGAPEGAEVRLDGVAVGPAPVALRVPPGRYAVTVEQGGRRLHEEAVDVAAGADVTVRAGQGP